jgi:hypothetical protein
LVHPIPDSKKAVKPAPMVILLVIAFGYNIETLTWARLFLQKRMVQTFPFEQDIGSASNSAGSFTAEFFICMRRLKSQVLFSSVFAIRLRQQNACQNLRIS